MSKVDYEALSKGLSRDMSGEAIARRLEIASELYDLARYLTKCRRLGKVERGSARETTAGLGKGQQGGRDPEPRE